MSDATGAALILDRRRAKLAALWKAKELEIRGRRHDVTSTSISSNFVHSCGTRDENIERVL